MSKKYFAVSDTHSFYNELIEALNQNKFDLDNPDYILLLLGDAFDRGDQSVEIFNFLKDLQSKDRLIYITGNHEDLLFECLSDISNGYVPGGHHFSNGTVKTLIDITGIPYKEFYKFPTQDFIKAVFDKTEELRDFIRANSINYFTLGNKIFVHSWIPLDGDEIYSDWDKEPTVENISKYWRLWRESRWGNPFAYWKHNLFPEGKCIVFGHWHCSYGHSWIDQKIKEWPPMNQPEKVKEAFSPWIKENAIGIDACCAYTHKINCLVFDENGEIINV